MEKVADERRIQARIQVDIPIVVELSDGSYQCRLGDISLEGAGAFIADGTLRVELGEHVRLHLPDKDVTGTAGVRRVVADSGFGVEFDDATIGAIVAGYAKAVV